MVVKVVDASAVAALLFGEPEAERVSAELENNTLVAPVLLGFEVASVCLKKLQRHPREKEALLTAFDWLRELNIEEIDVRLDQVIEIAEQTRLTVYDASYLWLARTVGAPLITLDAKLHRASRRNGR